MEFNLLEKRILELQEPGASNFFDYARWVVYLLVFLVPILVFPWTSEALEFNKQFVIFSLAGIGLVFYLVQVIRTGRLVFRKNAANLAVLVFLTAVLLTTVFSQFRYQSFFGGFNSGFHDSFLSSVSFAAFFFLVLNILGNAENPKQEIGKLAAIFSFSLLLALALGTFQLFGASVFRVFGLSAASFFNSVGALSSLGIVSAVLLVFYFLKLDFQPKGFFKYARVFMLLLPLFFLMVLNWWVLWFVAIVGLASIIILDSLSGRRISDYWGPAAVMALGVLFILSGFNLASVLGLEIPIELSPSFGSSFDVAKEVLMKSPFFGMGPENFSLAYDLYKPLSINGTAFWSLRFSRASSELLNRLITGGILGLAAFLFLLWAGFKSGLKKQTFLPSFAALAAASFLYPFNITLSFGLWFFFSLLVLDNSEKSSEVAIDLEESPRRSLVALGSFVAVLVLIITGFYFVVSRYYGNVKFAKVLNTGDADKQIQLLTEVIDLDRNEDLYSRALVNLSMNKINQELENLQQAEDDQERQAIISRIQNLSATAVNLSNEMTAEHPKDSINWFSRALVYESLTGIVGDSDDWAIKTYQEYMKFSPKDPTPYFNIGNIYMNKADSLRRQILQEGAQNFKPGDLADIQKQISSNLVLAEENYKKAIELKPDYVLAIYNLGVSYERQNRLKEAIQQLELTKSVNPSDASLAFQLGLLYYRNNQRDKSLEELERAVKIFPDFSNARWYLALLYEEKGDLDKSLGELRKIEKLNPDNEILEDKIKELEAGKRSIPPEKVTGVRPLE